MKQLIITIAAVVLVGCGPSVPDISIHRAAEKGNIEVVKKHLANGADINARDSDGLTPLIQAAFKGHNELVELLIAEGADVNAKDDDGSTALDFATDPDNPDASANASEETADLLRKHGAKTGEELKAEGK